MIVMGVDFGAKRIGIALSRSGVLATPLAILSNDGGPDAAALKIGLIATEHDVERIVLGNPARPGDERAISKFGRLAEELRRATGCEVVLWDEAYSTTEATSLRRERSRPSARKNRAPIDDEAAAVILQSYLDARSRGAAS